MHISKHMVTMVKTFLIVKYTADVINVVFVRGRFYCRGKICSARQHMSQSYLGWVPVYMFCLYRNP
jgi:hypothetical protein